MLGLEPTDAAMVAVRPCDGPLQAQERAQRQADVVALSLGGTHLRPLDAAALLEAAVIHLDRPGIATEAGARQRAHGPFVGCPVLPLTDLGRIPAIRNP